MLGRIAAVAVLSCCTCVAWAGDSPAARVSVVVGKVLAEDGTTSRILETGAAVYEGSVIKSAKKSRATLIFTDGSELIVGPSSEATITSYSFGSTAARMSLSLVKGAFRFLSGVIGKTRHDDVSILAPVATIGIRGTHFGAEVGADSATVLLLDQPDGTANAVEVSNAYGAVVLDQPGYGTHIPDAHSPPSPPKRLRLNAVERLSRNVFRTPVH